MAVPKGLSCARRVVETHENFRAIRFLLDLARFRTFACRCVTRFAGPSATLIYTGNAGKRQLYSSRISRGKTPPSARVMAAPANICIGKLRINAATMHRAPRAAPPAAAPLNANAMTNRFPFVRSRALERFNEYFCDPAHRSTIAFRFH